MIPCVQGVGLTGLLIASVLMLRNSLSPTAAINTLSSSNRPRSVQTKFQVTTPIERWIVPFRVESFAHGCVPYPRRIRS